MKLGSGVIAGVALVAASMAPAFAVEHRPYFGLSGGIVLDDDERFSNEGATYSLHLGQRIYERWGVEGSLFYSDFGRRVGDWSDYGAKLEALYHIGGSSLWDPYLAAGVGYIRSKERTLGFTSSDPIGTLGFGVIRRIQLGDTQLGLRGDYRFRVMDIGNAAGGTFDPFEEHIFTAGIVVPFGAPAASRDKVDPMLVDSDGDGVPDHLDLCPGTPRGVAVDARGCPLDSDGDGVPDSLDKCPGSAPGVAVGPDGCPIKVKADEAERSFESVLFAFDRSDLSVSARDVIDRALESIKKLTAQYPNVRVELSGHTDSIGTEGYNQALSERRANAVKQYMVRKGVAAERISTLAFGESKPIATNDTAEGRQLNRRVEIRTRAD